MHLKTRGWNNTKNAIWDHIKEFDPFGISWMDRSNNKMVDLLANLDIDPDDISFFGVFKIEM